MKRLVLIAAILGIVGLVVAKNTHLSSCIYTVTKMAEKQLKGSISPEFEIERLKNEIARLDSDVDRLIQQEAEMAVDLDSFKNKLKGREETLKQTKVNLVEFATKVKNSDSGFQFINVSYTPVTANKKLAADFQLYQSQEASVQSLRNLIAAKEKQYNSLVHKRNTFVTQKQTFQANVEQLEADWAELKNESNAPVSSFDTDRVAMIETGINELKRTIAIKQKEAEIRSEIPSFATSPAEATEPQIDPDVVLNALQNSAQNDNVAVATPKEE